MKEIVIKSTGCSVDICLRDVTTGEIEYLYTDVSDPEWIGALVKDSLDKLPVI